MFYCRYENAINFKEIIGTHPVLSNIIIRNYTIAPEDILDRKVITYSINTKEKARIIIKRNGSLYKIKVPKYKMFGIYENNKLNRLEYIVDFHMIIISTQYVQSPFDNFLGVEMNEDFSKVKSIFFTDNYRNQALYDDNGNIIKMFGKGKRLI